jgi:hypothetical protein
MVMIAPWFAPQASASSSSIGRKAYSPRWPQTKSIDRGRPIAGANGKRAPIRPPDRIYPWCRGRRRLGETFLRCRKLIISAQATSNLGTAFRRGRQGGYTHYRCRRTADKRDELAAPHLITSLARSIDTTAADCTLPDEATVRFRTNETAGKRARREVCNKTLTSLERLLGRKIGACSGDNQ